MHPVGDCSFLLTAMSGAMPKTLLIVDDHFNTPWKAYVWLKLVRVRRLGYSS